MTLDVQFQAMLAMVLAGFYVGIALETFRYFSPLWQKSLLWKYTLEIFFWTLQTIVVFFLLYNVNAGELRFYLFLAFFLGFSMYKALFSSLYQRLLRKMVAFFKALFLYLWRFVDYFIIKPVRGIILFLLKILLFFTRLIMTPLFYLVSPIFKAIKELIKKLPKPILSTLYKFSSIYGIMVSTFKKIKSLLTFQRR